MSVSVPVETAQNDLRTLLAQLKLGETITLVSSNGIPEALLVSLKAAPSQPQSSVDWEARWDTLAEKVSQAWKGNKSALTILTEMRR